MTTKVIFRVLIRKATELQLDDVIAFFPTIPGDMNPYRACQCYVHTGQHGAASIEFYRDSTRPATPKEYQDLLKELVSIGYNDLKICRRMTHKDFLKRKALTE